MRRALLTAALGLALVTLIGCVASGSSSRAISGTFVSNATLSHLERGVTTEDALLGLLGAPSRSVREGHRSIHVWRSVVTSTASGGVTFVASGKSRSTTQRTVFVEVRGGVVTDWWSDEPTPVGSDDAADA